MLEELKKKIQKTLERFDEKFLDKTHSCFKFPVDTEDMKSFIKQALTTQQESFEKLLGEVVGEEEIRLTKEIFEDRIKNNGKIKVTAHTSGTDIDGYNRKRKEIITTITNNGYKLNK